MVSQRAKRQYQNQLIGKPWCILLMVADEEQQWCNKEKVDDIDPDVGGGQSCKQTESVIEENNETDGSEGIIDPTGRVGTMESNKEQQGYNQEDVKKGQEDVHSSSLLEFKSILSLYGTISLRQK